MSDRQPQVSAEQALQLVAEQRYAEAEVAYSQLREQQGDSTELLNNHAIVCGALGQLDRKLELLRQAVTNDPNDRPTRLNLAFALLELNQSEEGLAAYQQLVAEDPKDPTAHRGVGRALLQLEDPTSALASFQQALDLAPNAAVHWLDLGRAQSALKQLEQAEASLRRAQELEPGDEGVVRTLASLLHQQGRVEEALATLRGALAVEPDNYDLLVELGSYLQGLGRDEEALEFLFYATSLEPDRTAAIARTALSLWNMGDLEQALNLLAVAENLNPLDIDVLNLIALCFGKIGVLSRAVYCYQKALEVSPLNTGVLSNLAMTQQRMGDLESAIATGRRALEIEPFHQIAALNLMFSFSTQADRFNNDALAFAKSYTNHLREGLAPVPPEALKRDPFLAESPRRLRIGFLSAEIGNHVVGRFLDSFLRHYNKDAFEVELISVTRRFEAYGMELAKRADAAHSLVGLEDEAARTFLRNRRYDVLVDTSGFTNSTGLLLLVQRCAPIQCHYIGYHASTGIDTIDYFIGDEETASCDLQPQFIEKLWRLPGPWLAAADFDSPPLAASKAVEQRPILGSFNQLAKVREQSLAYWVAAMKAVPEAHLIIKDFLCADQQTCKHILKQLTDKGIKRNRIHFIQPTSSQHDHLDLYNHIDIALDATPWSSATTGFDALAMGVPLVAIRGNCMAARMSSSLLRAIDRKEWITETTEEFAGTVRRLSKNLEFTRKSKTDLQLHVLRSPLFDGKSLSLKLQKAFQEMVLLKQKKQSK